MAAESGGLRFLWPFLQVVFETSFGHVEVVQRVAGRITHDRAFADTNIERRNRERATCLYECFHRFKHVINQKVNIAVARNLRVIVQDYFGMILTAS